MSTLYLQLDCRCQGRVLKGATVWNDDRYGEDGDADCHDDDDDDDDNKDDGHDCDDDDDEDDNYDDDDDAADDDDNEDEDGGGDDDDDGFEGDGAMIMLMLMPFKALHATLWKSSPARSSSPYPCHYQYHPRHYQFYAHHCQSTPHPFIPRPPHPHPPSSHTLSLSTRYPHHYQYWFLSLFFLVIVLFFLCFVISRTVILCQVKVSVIEQSGFDCHWCEYCRSETLGSAIGVLHESVKQNKSFMIVLVVY